MSKVQTRLTITLLFTALAMLAYFGTNLLSGPVAFLYRDASGFSAATGVAQAAALLAVAGLFLSGFFIAVPAALQPASWLRKVLYILPLYLLSFTLVGIIATRLGVGTVGILLNVTGVGPVTLATAWLAVGAVLAVLAVGIASARVHLRGRVVRAAGIVASAASALSMIAAVAMFASIVIISTNEPASFGFRGPGAGGLPPANEAQAPASTPEVAPGDQAPAATQAAPQQSAGPTNQGTGPSEGDRQRPEGGPEGQFPGSPGGGQPDFASRYTLGGGLMIVFALIGLIGGGVTLLILRGLRPGSRPAEAGTAGREITKALGSAVALTLVLLAVAQLGQVPHDNPPVLSEITWDSPQTEALVNRACMDCHSNETTWPWYAYIAPSSWLTSLHVTSARQQFNLSDLDSLPAFRRNNIAENMADQIRSGTMPPQDYLILHPDARLTEAEKQQLIEGLQKSLAQS